MTAPSTVVYGTGQLTASFTSSTATGPITFTLLDPTTAVGTTLGSAPLAASTASFDTSGLAVGSYTLLASYAGDSTHASAQSVPLSLRVTPRPLLVTPSSITLLYGQPIPTLTGTISGLLPQDSTGSLTASFAAPVTTLPPAAAYQISASITGSSAKNYTLTIIPATLTIAPAPTLTSLTASATSITSGNPLALATHIASTTAGTPTGSVTLMDGATPLLSLASSAGSATFTTTALSPGLHTLTTLYAGDKNFIQSVSTPALITVIPAPTTSQDFTLTPTGATSQAISSGGTANFSFNLQIQDSTLASPITLAATGLPALATASFNPAYLPPGATPGTFTLTISTPQTTALRRNSVATSPLLTLLLFPIAGVAFRLRSYNRTTKRVAFLILASILTFCSGCGSRINAGDPSTNPVKTYIITVTGTATGPTGNILQRSTTVKLLIQSGT
ncbi:MAG: Ig-like domain repeat protein [Edaphobacter sp.]